MRVVSIISTKGGVGKTTTAANLGGFASDAGLRVLLLDLDVQPTLSSYFALTSRAIGGVYELLAHNEHRVEHIVSHTSIANLDVVTSNDAQGQLNTLLLNAADGRLRLRHLLPMFQNDYDLMVLDTQGARSVMLELSVLASDLAIAPVTPEILAARELQRGTIQLMHDLAPFRHWGIAPPPLKLLLNRVHPVSSNARAIQASLRQIYRDDKAVSVMSTAVPMIEAYPRASMLALPAHRVERRKPAGRLAPTALATMRALCCELLPEWTHRFAKVSGTASDVENLDG